MSLDRPVCILDDAVQDARKRGHDGSYTRSIDRNQIAIRPSHVIRPGTPAINVLYINSVAAVDAESAYNSLTQRARNVQSCNSPRIAPNGRAEGTLREDCPER
jgi:hypothetical protein